MGPIGMQEMIALFVIALLLFGPKKLPELGRTLGKAISEFRRAKNELKSTFESHLHELERETRLPEVTSYSSSTATDSSPSRYSYPYEENNYESSDQSYTASVETSGSRETDSSQPSTASATATQDAEANQDHSSLSSAPVADTVPRNN